jgi:2'-5' RNA ligase
VRLFVALYPPGNVCDDLRRWLGRAARLTPVERWHLTLAFLGEVVAEEVPGVERAISRGVADATAMRLRLAGSGSFGRGRSTAVWTGVEGDLDALRDLHAALRRNLADAGIAHDARPLTPHLTVSYQGNRDVREALRDYAGPAWTADEIVLVRSSFPAQGGYDKLRTWPLQAADSS